MNHFEENLGYKVTVKDDEDLFPKTVEAKKETSLNMKKDDRGTFTWVDIEKFNELQEKVEWRRLVCFADHQHEIEERSKDIQIQERNCEEESRDAQEQERKREEKLRKRQEKMKQTIEEVKERLWKIKDDSDFEQKSQRIIEETTKNIKDILVQNDERRFRCN